MAMVVRTRSEPAAIAPGVAAAIRSVDPEQPIYDARPLEAVVDRSLGQRWVQTTLLAGFAAMAVLLASVGVYGVIAYGVGQRTREFGIRLALGARRSEIVALVMRRGAKLFAYGAAIGLAGALASARVLNALLFQVSGFDPASFIGATAILMTIALLACAVPARRAASVDAAIALRAE
jgi:putative ABC transport system permease protein